jgi:glycerate-2-kinase
MERPKTQRQFEELLDLTKNVQTLPDIKGLMEIGLNALIEGLNAVLPEKLVRNHLSLDKDQLWVGHEAVKYADFSEIIFVGGGKATARMAQEAVAIIGDKIPFSGVINIPFGQDMPEFLPSPSGKSQIKIQFARHPIPDENGMRGVQKMLDLIEKSPKNAIVIALISGGGSALMPLPADGITLEEKQAVNRLLIDCGASIEEINCIRKHISAFKGGQLSRFASPRRVFSLIISDVIGNDLQTIASGPTVPDLTYFSKAVEIAQKYHILNKFPASVRERLLDGEEGRVDETPKPDARLFDATTNYIIGSAETSASAVQQYLDERDIACDIFSTELSGEAREYGKRLVDLLPKFKAHSYPAVFVGTGEFTVSIRGKGKGGRNQEMLLGFLKELASDSEYSAHKLNYIIIAGAFDGIEGNSPAMGTVIYSGLLEKIQAQNLDLEYYLENNDSYSLFSKLGCTLEPGQTGTNVNDMLILIIEKKNE